MVAAVCCYVTFVAKHSSIHLEDEGWRPYGVEKFAEFGAAEFCEHRVLSFNVFLPDAESFKTPEVGYAISVHVQIPERSPSAELHPPKVSTKIYRLRPG